MNRFKLFSDFKPQGDQPAAIKKLSAGILAHDPYQTLLGVTGSGKTYTMAAVIEKVQRPTLIISPNKTLAAQLYQEFKAFFPENAVEYFVSYYDYYQPEAYLPTTDTYIEKEADINEEIDRLRHSATMSLILRRDVVVVASVSCIYSLGKPENYLEGSLLIKEKEELSLDALIKKLVAIQYERNDYSLKRGTFRVRGDSLEIWPIWEENLLRVEFFGDTIERIVALEKLTKKISQVLHECYIFPATHYVTFSDRLENGINSIKNELERELKDLKKRGKNLEAERLSRRTRYDLEMIRETGFCSGIENYSRHFEGRAPGDPPSTLLDYFPKDYLIFIDESHVAVPQIGGMYAGDRSRKESLVDFGFRLPSAKDNRPLNFDEFSKRVNQAIFVSATPGEYELKNSKGVVEQIIRPTGLIDPQITLKQTEGQIQDLLLRIQKVIERGERVLVTTLTKKMSEDLAEYLNEQGIKVRYLHSDIDTLKRMDILKGLRMGEFDVLVGINLLREGLDLPEVSLVAILDADKEGFLRNERSLIQTIGRAARNVNGEVVLYADRVTGSMQRAISETDRRRKKQINYNEEHGIVPQTIVKEIHDIREGLGDLKGEDLKEVKELIPPEELPLLIESLEKEMQTYATALEFEKAAKLRDQIKGLQKLS